jgi:hypothetical protein
VTSLTAGRVWYGVVPDLICQPSPSPAIKAHSSPTACQKLPPNFATRNPQPLYKSGQPGVKAGKTRSPLARCIEPFRQLDLHTRINFEAEPRWTFALGPNSECNSCSLGTSMLAPSLKRVNPQSLIFFELRHFEPLQRECTIRKWEAGWQHGTLWCHSLKKGL